MTSTISKHLSRVGTGLVLATIVLAGCRGGSAGIEGGGAVVVSPSGDTQLSKFVVINNKSLAAAVQVVDMKTEYAGDLLKGQVSLVSKSSKTQRCQYQFAWYNGNGIEIEAGRAPWIPVILYGNESKTLQGLAPNPQAREFKIKIRSM